jgi:hypothetical protein
LIGECAKQKLRILLRHDAADGQRPFRVRRQVQRCPQFVAVGPLSGNATGVGTVQTDDRVTTTPDRLWQRGPCIRVAFVVLKRYYGHNIDP